MNKNFNKFSNLAVGNFPALMSVQNFSSIGNNAMIYQEIFSRQQILNQAMPYALMQKFQAIDNFIQPELQNENLARLNKNLARLNEIAQSRNFLSSALAVQDAAIDFLSEMKKIDGYKQKTLGEILKEIQRKKKT